MARLQRKRRVADRLQDIKDLIQDNPYAEVAVLILVKVPWLRRNNLAGVLFFRRTWCNNIFLEYLVVHPLYARNPEGPVRGVGTAMLYFLSNIATEIDAGTIWGEATQNSAPFYRKMFGRKGIDDRIHLSRKTYKAFQVEMEAKLNPDA